MESFKDVINNIKDRFSNPLIFSFFCSWLFLNWQIIIALLWYDPSQLENEGHKSIYSFIKSNLNPKNSIILPAIFAGLYTLVSPIVRNLISAFYSWTIKWGESWNLKIIDKGKISIDKYLKLRTDHEQRRKLLEDVIAKESSYLDSYTAVNTQLLAVKANLNEVTSKLNDSETFYRQCKDISMLNGAWECTSQKANEDQKKEPIYIDSGRYFVNSSFSERVQWFDIQDFYFNNRTGNLFFTKEMTSAKKQERPNSEHYNINRLKFDGKDLLVGTENGTTKIEYRRR